MIAVFGERWRTRGLLMGAMRLLLAVAVLCGTVQAGARYFYCEAIGLSTSDPCTAMTHRAEQCPLDSLERQAIDCCSVITMPSMPDGARVQEPAVHPATVVAVVPAEVQYANGHAGVREMAFARRAGRWHKPPRPSAELRAQLMVFLT